MYVRRYVRTYVCMYVCIIVYVVVYVRTHAFVCVCVLYAPIHIYIHYLLLIWSLNQVPVFVLYTRLIFNGLLFICASPNCFLVTLLKANASCEEGRDLCGSNLICTRCTDSPFTDVVCQSGTPVC